jgi:hypothetical protein
MIREFLSFFGGFGKKSKPKYQQYGSAISMDTNFVQDKWTEIEALIAMGGASHKKTAIMEADKLVDYALKSKGVAGETMGERLKNAKNKFRNYSDYDNLWFAHKVRNSIAHEAGHDMVTSEVNRAIEAFKKALKALGAI